MLNRIHRLINLNRNNIYLVPRRFINQNINSNCPYEVLGIEKNSSLSEIKQAYKNMELTGGQNIEVKNAYIRLLREFQINESDILINEYKNQFSPKNNNVIWLTAIGCTTLVSLQYLYYDYNYKKYNTIHKQQ